MAVGARRRRGEEARADVDKNQEDSQLPQFMVGCAVTDVIMSDAEIPLLEAAEGTQFPLPDLNITLEVNADDESKDSRAIFPYEENSIRGAARTLKPTRQLHEEGFFYVYHVLQLLWACHKGTWATDGGCGPR
ncbi:PREDICTED: PRUPE_7G053800 [Prunus dulcis]|uniref:PREDICTED: PRUPE_7G053800 n=1 Tax=Prunus dulcis TaxID=3755 RepID=A0A5E4FL35_PRUDU|nr:PREDICTED: PRUPE_7G053800 [Prunus dulcis]